MRGKNAGNTPTGERGRKGILQVSSSERKVPGDVQGGRAALHVILDLLLPQ
jgi:hypothetical protein